ncbi:hypothetical protein U1Q18_007181 [Sarracenia purpurea var. burkii]
MAEPKSPKPELAVSENSGDDSSKRPVGPKVVLADLNVDPPETHGLDAVLVSTSDFARYLTLLRPPPPILRSNHFLWYDYIFNMRFVHSISSDKFFPKSLSESTFSV